MNITEFFLSGIMVDPSIINEHKGFIVPTTCANPLCFEESAERFNSIHSLNLFFGGAATSSFGSRNS